MKKVLSNILFYCVVPFAFPVYLVVDNWRALKRRKHRNHLHKIGRSTEFNPYTDKW